MPHLSPAHHETSKRDSPNETKIKEKQNETILDLNSNLTKSITHHNQTKEWTTWFLTYSDLVYDLLQAEKHDDLTLHNHHQCSVGSAPLPEVHYNVKSNEKGDVPKTPQKKFGKFKKGKHNCKNKKNRAKG
jgi:hypothetical protein